MVVPSESASTPTPPPAEPGAPASPPVDPEVARRQKLIIIAIIAIGVLFVVCTLAVFFLLIQPGMPTEAIKNVVLIFLTIEMLIVGIAVVVLTVQVATLINLLQNEVRPMLQATNETINHLRGTSEFLSENLVEPVMQLNGYLASLKRMLELIGLVRK